MTFLPVLSPSHIDGRSVANRSGRRKSREIWHFLSKKDRSHRKLVYSCTKPFAPGLCGNGFFSKFCVRREKWLNLSKCLWTTCVALFYNYQKQSTATIKKMLYFSCLLSKYLIKLLEILIGKIENKLKCTSSFVSEIICDV